MISDLPLCDRLSLKGKLFELQKKLQLIDLEQKLDEQYSYKPALRPYDLPNRQEHFIDNINKAELIRKQKKELLARSAVAANEENCTFSPTIYTKSHPSSTGTGKEKPVYDRLYAKASEYSQAASKRAEYYSSVDLSDGSRLFTPRLPAHSRALMTPSEVSADRFLYQDAKDRELRLAQLTEAADEQLAAAADFKMLSTSSHLLAAKADRQARKLFLLMHPAGGALTYEEVAKCLDTALADTPEEVRAARLASFWNAFGLAEVPQEVFIVTVRALLLHRPVSGIAAALKAEGRGPADCPLCTYKQSDMDDLRSLLHILVKEKPAEAENTPEEVPRFTPHIHPHSYKLAERKEARESTLIPEEVDASSLSASMSMASKRSAPERLLARAKLVQQSKASRAEELKAAEAAACTFKPTLQAAARKEVPAEEDVHERLYASRRTKAHFGMETTGASGQAGGPSSTPAMVSDLQACTFAPRIRPPPAYLRRPTSAPAIAGYDQSVNRQRAVLAAQQEKKAEDDKAFERAQAAYAKSRELAARGPEPFSLSTQSRSRFREPYTGPEMPGQPSSPEHEAGLIIDVKLGGARNARIRVMAGDDAAELSAGFGKIYGLDSAAVAVLTTVVKKSMARAGLLPVPEEPKRTWSDHRLRGSDLNLGIGSGLGDDLLEVSDPDCSSYTVSSASEEEEEENWASSPGKKHKKNRASLLSQLL